MNAGLEFQCRINVVAVKIRQRPLGVSECVPHFRIVSAADIIPHLFLELSDNIVILRDLNADIIGFHPHDKNVQTRTNHTFQPCQLLC